MGDNNSVGKIGWLDMAAGRGIESTGGPVPTSCGP